MSIAPISNAYYPENTDPQLVTRENANRILQIVQSKIPNHHSDRGHVDVIKRLMRAADPRRFASVQQFVQTVAAQTVREVNQRDLGRVDIREMLIGEMSKEDEEKGNLVNSAASRLSNSFNSSINMSDFLGVRTIADFRAAILPREATKKAYLTFDSFMRDLSSDGTTQFSWTLSTSNTVTQGTTNNTNAIRNMVGMRVYPFKIPYASAADNNGQISLGIDEFRSQGSLMYNQNFWHFMFTATREGQFIRLDPAYNNDGKFSFASPISSVDSFTLSFRNPVNLITFTTDRSNCSVLTYGTEMVIRCNRTHNLSTGDIVIISDFSTVNPTYDEAIIKSISNADGVNIDISTVPIAATDFSLYIDTTSIYNVAPSGTISVTNGSSIVTGAGTTFQTLFRPGDRIMINSLGYLVSTVQSDFQLLLTSTYTGATASGLAFIKDNRLDNLTFSCYFASKRFIMAMEVEYIDATIIN